ncbi:methyltransferase RsmF C-terminal domain-like protein, partial [Klebsiella pneumoniae]|uniref:methyltransferase RsmF C-terminal domain-like protein n=1 Tax=Klebsiella pneumoniae TaxID=573 RepID=UPI00274E2E2F|nr:16S rRNA (cytosine(1407)-C(5))-methyltransferase RsmF [Klebsiella pneumoniae]
ALEPLFGKVRFSRIGVRLAELHNKGYRWQHGAVIAFSAPQRAFELAQEEAEEWDRGGDVYPQTAPGQDETIVTFQGVPLGPAKRVGPRLKHSYPGEPVRGGKLFAGKG